ncbi:hypothetical protein [Nocardia asiatica]|uniref:hypothetical protein n=1 Tax=Nocardia asiatica TaxID=209252 RepID=UPI000310729E|nr:hypothetical protein [Nocardia asiatica]
MTEGGYFRVPYRLRRRVGLLIGQRTLLIGHRSRRALLIHPPAALDELCAASLRLLIGRLLAGAACTGEYPRNPRRGSTRTRW